VTRCVRYSVSDHIATITLNRPEVLNAIDSAMRTELPVAVRQAAADPDVRVILLQGAGERAFCAGADITEFNAGRSLVEERASRCAPTWIDVLAEVTKPVVAAIHGYCLGGGLEIALACDIRVAAADSVFGLPEVRLGIVPGAGGTQRLPRTVGVGAALRLILTGDRIDAPEAHRLGLVSEIVEPDQLVTHATELAARIARGGPLALAYAKEAVRRGSELPLADGLRLEADLATLLVSTDDRREGANAFAERRPPVYRGE
jgi:enoyl-CoA hydratase/carnithine racemase